MTVATEVSVPVVLQRQRYDAARLIVAVACDGNGAAGTVLQIVDPEELPSPFRQHLESISRLRKAGIAVDVLSLTADLRAADELENVGGASGIGELIDCHADPNLLSLYVSRLHDTTRELEHLDAAAQSVVAAGGRVEFEAEAQKGPIVFPRTDAGSGELIAQLHGDRLRYDHRRGRWLLWSGHYWTADCAAAIRNMAIEAARWRYQRASSIADLKAREAEAKFAIKGESRDKVEAALYFAEAMSPIADRGDDWDRQPHLMGCPNGIVDLKTGILRDGRPEDCITMTTGIPFEPDAPGPRWDLFLHEIFSGADELIDWIHRAIGHSATGDTSEQIVCILHGEGCNGKSVFCSTLRHVLGDYAHTMPFSTVEDGTRRSIPNDVAALVNRRFVFASETKENRRLNEARIKELTGGDAIPARFLNHEWFTFQPVLKPWLAVNHLPLVEDLSFGFWRRVRTIPFLRQFKGDQDDKHLTDTLKTEAPGILAWIVRGAVRWYAHGLVPIPEAVTTATNEYERSSDELGEYIAERLFLNDDFTTRAGLLFKDYTAWADDRGMKKDDRMTATAFGRSMGKRFRKTSDKHGTVYHGIGLPAPDEEGRPHE